MTPTRWRCAFAETCRFRSDPDLTNTREDDRIVMQGSGRRHPTLVCPHRHDSPSGTQPTTGSSSSGWIGSRSSAARDWFRSGTPRRLHRGDTAV